jgi:opacity protein-like surface antigen
MFGKRNLGVATAASRGWVSRNTILAGVAAMAMSSSAAFADTCVDPTIGTTFTGGLPGMTASIAGGIQTAITTSQTAFLLQSTAFVSNPGNPQPDQQGSGVWSRVVGGISNLQNPSTSVITISTPTGPAGLNGTGVGTCDSTIRTKFSGVQVGHDVAKLNYNGWNIHFGTTAGYIETRSAPNGGNSAGGSFTSVVQSPFAGTYVVVSKGGFFADALLRFEHYEATFHSPSFGIRNQSINARGVSVAASAGYHYSIPETRHFFEPSVGVVASRTKVDTFNHGGAPGTVGFGLPAAINVNDIESVIGRAGFRVGTTVDGGAWVVQPFFAASIWHEFAGSPTATYRTDATLFPVNIPTEITAAYTGSNVGTYAQFSVGASGQLVGTGWVGFVRFDYRTGNRLEGWDGTGGLRYHFTPEPAIALVGKSPVKAPVVAAAHNWTGFYMGASAGAGFARSTMSIDTSVGGVPETIRPDPRGGGMIGGGQIGYNWQFNPQWVGGIEGTLDLSNLNGAKECNPLPLRSPLTPIPPFGDRNGLYNTTCSFDSHWLATLTGRLGYVWGRALWYVKAGGAWTREEIGTDCNAVAAGSYPCTGTTVVLPDFGNPANNFTVSGSGTVDRFGWTAGYGLEFALTSHWSARAETSYYSFGNRSVVLSNGIPVSSKYEIITTKIGVNYKLSNR